MTQSGDHEKRPCLLLVGDEGVCTPLARALDDSYRTEYVGDLARAIGRLGRGGLDAVLLEAALLRHAPVSMRQQVDWPERDVPLILLVDSAEPVPLDLIRESNAYHALPYTGRSWEYVARSIVDVLAQCDLERENELLRKVVASASDCIMVVDEKGAMHLVNGAVVRTFGYMRTELLGAQMTALFPLETEEGGGANFHAAVQAGEPWWGEVTAQRRDGSRFPVHVALSFAHDPQGAATYAVVIARDVSDLQRLLGHLTQLSIVDDLTQLYNVRYFWARFRYEMQRSRRYGHALALLMLDLDHFKQFNDKYGHQTGDEVLRHVATVMKEVTREVDIVARYGGEEFAVILPNTEMAGALTCAENIRRSIESRGLDVNGRCLSITASVGVAWLAEGVKDEDELLRRADTALRRAKNMGRNCVRLWHPDDGVLLETGN